VLVIGTALSGLTYVPFSLQLSTGWTKYGLQQGIVSAICFPLLLTWMIQRYGVAGAAYARLTLYFLQALVGVPVTHSRILVGHAWTWFWKDTLVPAGVALTIVSISAISSHNALGPIGRILWILATVVIATLGSAMVCRELRSVILRTLRRGLQNLRFEPAV
jgi:hypothetical protein